MTQNLTSIADEHSINQPIEYNKSGLNQNNDELSIVEKSNTDLKHQENQSTIENDNTNISCFKLTELPNEIILNITNNLSQFDVLHFIRTCSRFYHLTLPQLYQHIIIDENFESSNQKYETNGRTYINNKFKLKKFCKTYDEKSDNDSSNINIKIDKFECLELPDSITFHDDDFLADMVYLFNNLNHLTSLIWLDKGFRLDLLYYLRNTELITTLILNVTPKARRGRNNRFYYKKNEEDYNNLIFDLKFPNLRNFQIKPFQNSEVLLNLINGLLINQNNPNEKCKTLGFFGGDNAFESIRNNRILECIFEESKIQYLENLTSLSISDIGVRQNDSDYLINCINLQNLKHLQLSRIEDFSRNGTLNSNFLTDIAPFLTSIIHLSLRIHQKIHLMLQFFEILAQNNTKLKVLDLSEKFHPDLSSSISKFQNLKKLSLEIFDRRGYEYLDIFDSRDDGTQNEGLVMFDPTMYDEWLKVQNNALLHLKYIRIDNSLFQCESNSILNPVDGLDCWFRSKVRCVSLMEWSNEFGMD
ncbi:uncharacterized protein KGF55_000178 [Candida pseudojiufengensis]|uniref:uncharacterized protein n=1 Tax=Candida pseudojiufengensis TaxID=497109 RepID=UPI00222404D8|nr:uncharacterized protein KGF55_000178 [Candida pseudojiufengensis]KAI5966769.1 hypothetical protein KGF55_000178 [Candida pseudojiufengensis]